MHRVTLQDAFGTQLGDHNVQNFYLPTLSAQWPLRLGMIPPSASCFQRRAVLDAVDQMLPDVSEATTSRPPKVLSGLGGVGKTQVAVRYVEQQWARRALDLLVWVTATSKDAIVTGYAETALRVLGADNVGPQQSAERLLTWLASTDKAWLIALDDLQDPGDIRGLWPPNTQTGQVLITTRRRDATLTHLGRAVFDIDVFTPEESVAYLHAALASHEYLAEGAPGLAADLGHLPLALAQAVAYLIDRDLSCESYRARLADRRRSLTEVFPARGELPDDQRTTIAATWSLSVGLPNRLAPAGVARPFLEIASLLDPHGFPIEVITNGPILNYLTRLLNRDVDADDVHDTERFSLRDPALFHRPQLRAHLPHLGRTYDQVDISTSEACDSRPSTDTARQHSG